MRNLMLKSLLLVYFSRVSNSYYVTTTEDPYTRTTDVPRTSEDPYTRTTYVPRTTEDPYTRTTYVPRTSEDPYTRTTYVPRTTEDPYTRTTDVPRTTEDPYTRKTDVPRTTEDPYTRTTDVPRTSEDPYTRTTDVPRTTEDPYTRKTDVPRTSEDPYTRTTYVPRTTEDPYTRTTDVPRTTEDPYTRKTDVPRTTEDPYTRTTDVPRTSEDPYTRTTDVPRTSEDPYTRKTDVPRTTEDPYTRTTDVPRTSEDPYTRTTDVPRTTEDPYTRKTDVPRTTEDPYTRTTDVPRTSEDPYTRTTYVPRTTEDPYTRTTDVPRTTEDPYTRTTYVPRTTEDPYTRTTDVPRTTEDPYTRTTDVPRTSEDPYTRTTDVPRTTEDPYTRKTDVPRTTEDPYTRTTNVPRTTEDPYTRITDDPRTTDDSTRFRPTTDEIPASTAPSNDCTIEGVRVLELPQGEVFTINRTIPDFTRVAVSIPPDTYFVLGRDVTYFSVSKNEYVTASDAYSTTRARLYVAPIDETMEISRPSEHFYYNFTILLGCYGFNHEIETLIPIHETNTYTPEFSQRVYEYSLFSPYKQDFDRLQELYPITAVDNDLSNTQVKFAIERNDYFELEYEHVIPGTLNKKHLAKLVPKDSSSNLNIPSLELVIFVTDLGYPPRSSNATLRIKSANTKVPTFKMPYYIGDYYRNHTFSMRSQPELEYTTSDYSISVTIHNVNNYERDHFFVNAFKNGTMQLSKSYNLDEITIYKYSYLLFTLTATYNSDTSYFDPVSQGSTSIIIEMHSN
ncbi:hypothetical protein NQ315_003399 [Exocentrus adspersus]|uniref:Cadherin domain-containing protein n=1 Tax=Exocentrus adspersus TaxID=1586481 RepID=A0AAV8VND7_9CUCU|nr:hypothetical protein NQ315_003399 [Exocentrus adspersus]